VLWLVTGFFVQFNHTDQYRSTKEINVMNTNRKTTVSEIDKPMNTHRQAATIVGVLFILATVSAMMGLLFYQPILTGPDYFMNGVEQKNQVVLGALMELVLVVTAIGTAIGLFPVLRPYGERIALGHLFFRFLEAVVITIGIVAILSLLTLSQAFVAAVAPNASAYDAAGTLLRSVYKWTSMLGPLFFLGINTFMYSYLLYKSKLVPRPLAVLGLTGATLVFGYAMLVMFGVAVQGSAPFVILALPIAAYEMILAGWLIVKGFNPTAIASQATTTSGLVAKPLIPLVGPANS
jgi:Domain of unknown function (DUF4386)